MTLKRASIDMLFAIGGLGVIAALFLPGQQPNVAPLAVTPIAAQELPKPAPRLVAVAPPARPSRAQLVDPLFSSSAEARDRAVNLQLLEASTDLQRRRPDPAIRVFRGPNVDANLPRVGMDR